MRKRRILKDVKVDGIALTGAPANGQPFLLYKSQDGDAWPTNSAGAKEDASMTDIVSQPSSEELEHIRATAIAKSAHGDDAVRLESVGHLLRSATDVTAEDVLAIAKAAGIKGLAKAKSDDEDDDEEYDEDEDDGGEDDEDEEDDDDDDADDDEEEDDEGADDTAAMKKLPPAMREKARQKMKKGGPGSGRYPAGSHGNSSDGGGDKEKSSSGESGKFAAQGRSQDSNTTYSHNALQQGSRSMQRERNIHDAAKASAQAEKSGSSKDHNAAAKAHETAAANLHAHARTLASSKEARAMHQEAVRHAQAAKEHKMAAQNARTGFVKKSLTSDENAGKQELAYMVEDLEKAEWDESSHPRDDNGRFGTSAGGNTKESKEARSSSEKAFKSGSPDDHADAADAHQAAASKSNGGQIEHAHLIAAAQHRMEAAKAEGAKNAPKDAKAASSRKAADEASKKAFSTNSRADHLIASRAHYNAQKDSQKAFDKKSAPHSHVGYHSAAGEMHSLLGARPELKKSLTLDEDSGKQGGAFMPEDLEKSERVDLLKAHRELLEKHEAMSARLETAEAELHDQRQAALFKSIQEEVARDYGHLGVDKNDLANILKKSRESGDEAHGEAMVKMLKSLNEQAKMTNAGGNIFKAQSRTPAFSVSTGDDMTRSQFEARLAERIAKSDDGKKSRHDHFIEEINTPEGRAAWAQSLEGSN